MSGMIKPCAAAIADMFRRVGPYLLLELLLPGGTLIALLLYLQRTGRLDPRRGGMRRARMTMLTAVARAKRAARQAMPDWMHVVSAEPARRRDGLEPLAMSPVD